MSDVHYFFPPASAYALNRFLFQERGFHGSHTEYYSRSNSYLNEVIDDREGLPITLSVLYIEVARRLKLNVVGLALPAHFVVRYEGGPQIVDVFDGKLLSREEAEAKVKKITGRTPEDEDFKPVAKKFIIQRMLHNLINVAEKERDRDSILRYLDAIVGIDPDAHEERWARAVFRFQSGRKTGALADCEHLLKYAPAEANLEAVRELRRILEKK